jgi:hypothetical protein
MIPTHPVPPWLRGLVFGGATLLAVSLAVVTPVGGAAGRATTLPEFKHANAEAWINSAPLSKASLQGKVVLLEVYTSG